MSAITATAAIAVVVLGVPVGYEYALENLDFGQDIVSQTDLHQVVGMQDFFFRYDGLKAPALDSMTSEAAQREFTGLDGVSLADISGDAQLAYKATEDRTGFIAVTLSKSGKFWLVSDSHKSLVSCEEYTVECVAQVTDHPELISAVPQWVTSF